MRTVLLASLTLVACEKGPAPGPQQPAAATATATAASLEPAVVVGEDTLASSVGAIEIHPVQHATLWLRVGDQVVWVDPWSKARLEGPKADLVLITDVHPDHFDPEGLAAVRGANAVVVAPKAVAEQVPGAIALANGESRQVGALRVEAVAMYNLTRGPEAGKLYHEKGRGNGYVINAGDARLYLSGDTECTPEMKALRDIDVAFVCMNLPYTMPPSEAAACVAAFKPKVLYPYHYRDSPLGELQSALAGTGVELRLREWYPGGP